MIADSIANSELLGLKKSMGPATRAPCRRCLAQQVCRTPPSPTHPHAPPPTPAPPLPPPHPPFSLTTPHHTTPHHTTPHHTTPHHTTPHHTTTHHTQPHPTYLLAQVVPGDPRATPLRMPNSFLPWKPDGKCTDEDMTTNLDLTRQGHLQARAASSLALSLPSALSLPFSLVSISTRSTRITVRPPNHPTTRPCAVGYCHSTRSPAV